MGSPVLRLYVTDRSETRPAAVAGDNGAVYEVGIVAGQEQCGIGDILWHTHFRGVGQQGAGAFKAKFICLGITSGISVRVPLGEMQLECSSLYAMY